jgi:tetratricopeptide (TPR) repeat protein
VAHRLRGTVYRDARWFQKAFADFDRAILINPQYARAYYDRALGYSMAGQFGQAITDYDESIRLDPQYAKTYGLRAIAYDYLGQSQRAIDDYSEAIRLEPTAFLYAARGRVYEIQGRNTEALADFEKVIAITDDQSLANEARQQIETMASSSPPVTTPSSNPLTEHQVVTRDIVANKATFDQDTITVPATAVVLLAFQNHDNVAYNFSIYDDSTTSSLIFRGVSNIGPSRHMYQFTAPATPGIYYFRCDEYPASMNGSLIVVTPNS